MEGYLFERIQLWLRLVGGLSTYQTFKSGFHLWKVGNPDIGNITMKRYFYISLISNSNDNTTWK